MNTHKKSSPHAALLILACILTAPSFAQVCSNINFESSPPGAYSVSSSVSGWLLGSTTSSLYYCNAASYTWTGGSSNFTLSATPITGIAGIGTLPNSPLGGTVIAALNGTLTGYHATRITKTISVTNANPIVNYAIAFVLQDGGSAHNCCDQAHGEVIIRDPAGNVDPCNSVNALPLNCQGNNLTCSVSAGYFFSGWQVRSINLSAYIGNTVTLEVSAWSCSYGGHYGRLFFDAECGTTMQNCNCSPGNNAAQVNYCAGANQAIINAPAGMTSYSWTGAGPIPAGQSTLASLTIPNPSPGLIYTVSMTSTVGCPSAVTYTLVYTTVGAGSNSLSPACGTNANGSATVYPKGSGSGYNFVWLNSSNSIVATSQSAYNLPPGNYSVQISASPGCGSVTTVLNIPSFSNSVGISQPGASSGCSSYSTSAFVTFGASPAPNAYTYSWTPSTFLNNQGAPFAVFTPSCAPGSSLAVVYSVVVTPTAFPHCAETKTLQIRVGDPPAPTLQPAAALCLNDPPTQLAASPSGGNYVGGTSALSASGLFTPSLSSAGTHTYSYSINWAGCIKTVKDSITVKPLPALAISGNTVICAGGNATLSANGAGTYTWSNSALTQSIIVSPPVTTVYVVAGSDPGTGCSSSASAQVNVFQNPAVTISGPDTVCAGASFVLLAGGASSYSWQNSAVTPTVSFTLTAGQHQFSVTGFSGASACNGSAAHSVYVANVPTVQVTGNTAICEGETLTLTATGAQTYSWSNGATGPVIVITPSAGSVWSVSGADNQQCEDIVVFSVVVDACTGTFSRAGSGLPVLFPNPAGEFVNFNAVHDGVVRIFDVNGRLVLQGGIAAGGARLLIAGLPAGVYNLRFTSTEGDSYYRFVKH